MKKLILIVWGWDESFTGEELRPWFTHETKSALWLANVKDDIKKVADIISKIESWQEHQILVFLHETEPHKYRRSDQEQLFQELGPEAAHVRSRLFSGGNGSIYFGRNCNCGIIGVEGRLAESYREDRFSDEIEANFILDKEKKVINQKHFDYVWDAYWHQPSDVIFRMTERFNRKARGFERKDGDANQFISHLKTDIKLWHQLHSFAGIPLLGENPVGTAALEYNLGTYFSEFEESGVTNLISDLENARAGIKNLLQNGTFGGESHDKTVSIVYNKLFDLHDKVVGHEHTKK